MKRQSAGFSELITHRPSLSAPWLALSYIPSVIHRSADSQCSTDRINPPLSTRICSWFQASRPSGVRLGRTILPTTYHSHRNQESLFHASPPFFHLGTLPKVFSHTFSFLLLTQNGRLMKFVDGNRRFPRRRRGGAMSLPFYIHPHNFHLISAISSFRFTEVTTFWLDFVASPTGFLIPCSQTDFCHILMFIAFLHHIVHFTRESLSLSSHTSSFSSLMSAVPSSSCTAVELQKNRPSTELGTGSFLSSLLSSYSNKHGADQVYFSARWQNQTFSRRCAPHDEEQEGWMGQ